MASTIIAPASGSAQAGVSVVRMSGPSVLELCDLLLGRRPIPRLASLCAVRDAGGGLIDRALVLRFEAPASFTGEDVLEIHCHGSVAVVSAVLDTALTLPDVRLAEPGEFTRRAFENGKMDLSAAEGLADLIEAQTQSQRQQALAQMDGALADVVEAWRAELLHAMALSEADIDFPDEDLPPGLSDGLQRQLLVLKVAIEAALAGAVGARKVREGFRVALIGPPNAGKSSLLNALAQSDVAIVSPIAGTTRDVIEVRLRMHGHLVLISDTAGLRDSDDVIEQEGVRRSLKQADAADLRVFLFEQVADIEASGVQLRADDLTVWSKSDLRDVASDLAKTLQVSVKTGQGIEELVKRIGVRAAAEVRSLDGALTRARHIEAAREALACVGRVLERPDQPIELIAEELRMAARALGRITGRVDVEEILGAVFSQFCIGK